MAALSLLLAMSAAPADIQDYYFKKGTVRVLIISGRNNHDWRTSTPFMQKILEETGRFDVRLEEEPNGITEATLAPFDVLVMDYCGPRWPETTEKAIESFVRSGKGMVVVHAASYQFGDQVVLGANFVKTTVLEPIWPEWRKMVGVYFDAVHDPRTGHGSRYTFRLKFTDRDHPILKGLDEDLYATDEFYANFRYEPGVRLNVIATAYDDPKYRGTGKDEPVLMTLQYGHGRVFHTILGHDLTGLEESGFVIPFVRGVEWAATGSVTIPTPAEMRAVKKKLLRILVVTGGHPYETSFYSVFDGIDNIIWDHASSNAEAFRRDLRDRYDVLVLYDYSQKLSGEGRRNLRNFVEGGKGVVVMHQAIADYQAWPWWYEEVVGGRYVLSPDRGMPSSTASEGEDEVVRPVEEKHPIISDIGPMHLKDEPYKGMWISKEVKVLLTTDNAKSDGPLAWISPYQKSRVVYIQPGHGHEAHRYPAYRQLVKNAIIWAGGR